MTLNRPASRSMSPLQAYAARHGLAPDAFAAGGRLTLVVDGRLRIQLRPARDGRTVVNALLVDLARLPGGRADEALLRLAAYVPAMARAHGAALAVDESGQQLLLQQVISADLDAQQFDAEVADFINVLAFWSRAGAQEASRPKA